MENINLLNDVYYSDEYISLYLKEDDSLFNFEYAENNYFLINNSIKRKIKKIGNYNVDEEYYDLETAYGYGGFCTNSNDKEFLARALENYKQKCSDENIIAEFIRFHPFNRFPIDNASFFDFNIEDRDIVVKKLSDNIISSYTSKVRNIVKRANEKVFCQESYNIDKFMELYALTMKKNSASDFYLFDRNYYQKLLHHKDIKLYEIIFENEIIAMGFFMFGDNIAHYHLSANTEKSYKLNANYALLNHLFEIANSLNIDYFMLGGGTTSFNDDSLLKFKKKFSKDTLSFYISGKIYNKEIYDKFNKIWKEQSKEDIRYFLKYRLEIK